MEQLIPVICDKCRTVGTAGQSDFTHLGDLLEFDPVVVQPRPNGWTPDAQRAFIALFATTGSKRRSALALGRNVNGIDQLLKRPGAASFRLAFDRAEALAKAAGTTRLAVGVADAARNSLLTPPSRLHGDERFASFEEEQADEDSQFLLLDSIFRKHLLKVQAERTARLAGDVVTADFMLRQVTMIEIALDLMGEGLGLDVWPMLDSLRRGNHGLLDLAETPMSRTLDAHRRQAWAAMGDPERPEHPPQRYLEPYPDYALEPLQALGRASRPPPGIDPDKWAEMAIADQESVLEDLHRKAAEEQVAWESRAVAKHKKQSRSDT